MASASAIGVDMGSQRTVIAVASRGGVDIICNEASNRETPNLASYGTSERYLGPAGQAKFKSNFKNTVSFFNRFLGMKGDSVDFKEEKNHVYCKTKVNEQNKVVFSINAYGENIELLPEQVYATMLTKVKQILELNNINNKELVQSIPPYYSQEERRLVLLAGKVSGLNIVKLMSETAATVLNYGIFRKKDLSETDPRLVAFVDVGHSKTNVFFAKVKRNGAEVVMEKCIRSLGGRNFDMVLYNKYREMFDNENQIDLNEYPKSKMRLFDAIEKQRKILSANSEANVSVECLAEDLDFSYTIKRDEFEVLSQKLLSNFGNLIQEALNESGYKSKDFHSIEIIGGATRIPALQALIKKTFDVQELSRTLNATECVARGCAILAAAKSPLFQVAEYNVKEKNQNNILCKYTVEKLQENGETEIKEFNNTLFKKDIEYPTVMTIGVQKTLQANQQVFLESENPIHDERLQIDIQTSKIKPKEEDFKILLKARIDDNGLVSMKGVEMEEAYIEEVKKVKKSKGSAKKDDKSKKEDSKSKKMDVETPNEGEENPSKNKDEKGSNSKMAEETKKNNKKDEEETTEKKKKSRFTEVSFTSNLKSNDSKQIFEDLYALEGQMCYKDKLVRETISTKNTLESLIYSSRDKLTSDWKVYSKEDESKQILEIAQRIEDWLYDDGRDVSKDQYIEKLEQLEKVVKPVKDRLEAYLKLKSGQEYAHAKLIFYQNAIASDPKKYEHLTEEDQGQILSWVQLGMEFFTDIQKKLSQVKLENDPPVNFEDMVNKMNEIEKECNNILNKPKPAPPKEEKKDGEKSEEKKDEEKKDGENRENGDNKMDEEHLGAVDEQKEKTENEKNN